MTTHLCRWCKQEIDPRRHPFVLTTVPLPNGEKFTYRYHARACYSAWRDFLQSHDFQPLDPDTHDHE